MAILEATHLVVETRGGGAKAFRWDHIADVRVTTLAERTVGRISGYITRLDTNEPFVEVRLKQSLRLGLSTRSGTDIVGLPTVLIRTQDVYVEDPEALVQEAQRYLAG